MLVSALTAGAALTPTEWSHRQALNVSAPGLVRVDLTAASFDSATPSLQDFRIIDANGRELASLLNNPPQPAPRVARPAAFSVRLESGNTILSLTTGTRDPLASVTLETPQPFFLRAARVEISNDGASWTVLDEGLPLFRQWGAEKLDLPLGYHPAAFVRVVVIDRGAGVVPFTGARLSVGAAPGPAPMPVRAWITSREEFAGETVLTVALEGRNVPLTSLAIDTPEPLFMRRVAVTVREVRDAVPGERMLVTGALFRVALGVASTRSQLELPLNFSAPTRELLVHIYNGDSPPLVVDNIRLERWPVNLMFMAPAAGRYLLLSGNPQAGPAHYDLASFAGEMRAANAAGVVPGDLEATPNYRPRQSLATAPLPEVPLQGAPIDASAWSDRRDLIMQRPGVQELELDLEALAKSRPDFADLRVLNDGNQIPYVLELPALARSIALKAESTPDPKRPNVSVWQLQLPEAGAPLRRLVLSSRTALFAREFRIYEKISTASGQRLDHVVAVGTWRRTPEPGMPETRSFELSDRLKTDTLWIEADNDDNPPIALGAVQAVYPVVRLVFKAIETDGYCLIYGHPTVAAPRYDLRLVADRLLTASRSVVHLSPAKPNPVAIRNPLAGIDGAYFFWGALALVVIVLLVVVAKMLPKPPVI